MKSISPQTLSSPYSPAYRPSWIALAAAGALLLFSACDVNTAELSAPATPRAAQPAQPAQPVVKKEQAGKQKPAKKNVDVDNIIECGPAPALDS